MGIVIRQTIKSSIFVYIGVFVGVINRLYLYPKFMTLEQIGFISVFFNIGMILSQVGMMGSTTTFSKFFQYFKEKNMSSVFYFLFVLVSAIGGLICTAILFIWKEPLIHIFSKDSTLVFDYFHYLPFLLFFIIYNNVFTLFSHNSLRLTVPSILNDFGIKFITAIGVLLYGLELIDFTQFVIIFIASYLIADIGILAYCIRLFKVQFSTAIHRIKKNEYKELRNYSFFIFVGGLSSSVTNYADTLMLSSLLGFSAVGVYSVALFMGMVIEVPKKAIIAISTPIISKHWLENNINEIHKLYKQSSINQGIVGLFLLLLLWVNLDEIYFFIPNSEAYIAGKYVALFIGLAKVTDMFMGINSEILRTSKHYFYDLTVTILFIGISIGTNWLLIPILQLNGAAIATLISVMFYNIMRYVILKKLYDISPFDNKSWQLIGSFVLFFGAYYAVDVFLPNANSYISAVILITIKSIVFGAVSLACTYYLKFSLDFNRVLDNLLDKLLRR